MKVRIKFRKYGVLRFIGHLDVMRCFQKIMRRAQIPIAFTSGYSPHMIMSFASPLGIGLTSDGEYFDIELTESISSKEAVCRMNAAAPEGIEVVSFRQIAEEKKWTGMAITAAADYLVGIHEKGEAKCPSKESYNLRFSKRKELYSEKYAADIAAFLEQPRILVVKQTKRSQQETDIRPHIYQMEPKQDSIYLKLAAGSVHNLKPELVMSAFCSFAEIDRDSLQFSLHRLEMYAHKEPAIKSGSLFPENGMPCSVVKRTSDSEQDRVENNLVTLEDLGKDIESREIHG